MRRQDLGTPIYGELKYVLDRIDKAEDYIEEAEINIREGHLLGLTRAQYSVRQAIASLQEADSRLEYKIGRK